MKTAIKTNTSRHFTKATLESALKSDIHHSAEYMIGSTRIPQDMLPEFLRMNQGLKRTKASNPLGEIEAWMTKKGLEVTHLSLSL